MNLEEVNQAIHRLVNRHRTVLNALGRLETQALELGALVLAVEHYRRAGFASRAVNLFSGTFRVKLTAKGYPSNFSWYEVERGATKYEIHANLAVRSANGMDGGIYVVDVGVVRAGAVARERARGAVREGARTVARVSGGAARTNRQMDSAAKNAALVTFIEAKKLVIYPMLLAQFFGIVHEIKPEYLSPGERLPRAHFFPALVTVGYLKGTSKNIVDGFNARGFKVNVVPTFDAEVVQMARDPNYPSPFSPRRVARPGLTALSREAVDVPF